MSTHATTDLIRLFHHRWAAPALSLLDERGGARFVELQRHLGVGRESLHRALAALIELGYAVRNPGYGHPLRPEYVITQRGRRAAPLASRVIRFPDSDALLRKWSVPVLAELSGERRFSELRVALPGITARSLALTLRDLADAKLVRRDVRPTRPPSTVYSATRAGDRVLGRR